MMLPLGACAQSGSGAGLKDVVKRELPGPPAYLVPINVPEPKAGENMEVIASRERAGRVDANKRITAGRKQWIKNVKTYQRTR